MAIKFFEEEIDANIQNESILRSWLNKIALNKDYEIKELNYIFCSDEYLHQINLDYLNHDTYTDIITFDHSEAKKDIEGDIYISVERVSENAKMYNVTYPTELHRVMVHGLLHLLGYKDKTLDEEGEMREREEACLSLLAKMK